MRHRQRGRTLGRSPSHRKAMLKNLASSLFLTRRDPEHPMYDKTLDPKAPNPPKAPGRIVTTVQKAKEVRSLVEKCITIARHSLKHEDEAEQYATNAERNSDEWKAWRKSDNWKKWVDARAPVVAARRRALQMLGDKEAVEILFDDVAPDFEDRPGGYTRVLRIAKPRLGDSGEQAILEFVGVHDRVIERSEKPAFAEDEFESEEPAEEKAAAEEETSEEETPAEETAESESGEEAAAEETPAEEEDEEKT
jgi:large subunit ribosomal protein L17